MKKQLDIFTFTTIGLGMVFGVLGYLTLLLNHQALLPIFRGMFLLLVFLLIVLRTKTSWAHSGVLVVCLFAFVAMFIDVAGNELFNLPLKWLVNNSTQEFQIVRNEIVEGTVSNLVYRFSIVSKAGIMRETIHFGWMLAFRFIEYLLITSVLLTVMDWLRIRVKRTKKKERTLKVVETSQLSGFVSSQLD